MKRKLRIVTLLLIISIIISVNFIDNKSVYAAGEVVELKDVPIGDIVYDDDSIWEWKDGSNYSGTTRKTAPIEWIVVSNNHFEEDTTLLISKDCVALYYFKSGNSSDKWTISSLRAWLRGTFYNHLSQNFKNKIVNVMTYSADDPSTDNIFILSKIELGGNHAYLIGNHGNHIAYFNSDTRRKARAYYNSSTLQDWNYWTRSSSSRYDPHLTIETVHPYGPFDSVSYTDLENFGVRPALNLKDTVRVEKQSDGRWKILWNQDPIIALTSPTSNSSLNSRHTFLKEVV